MKSDAGVAATHAMLLTSLLDPHSASTSTGGAARQGDQWRNIFWPNRTGRLESTKIILPENVFCFRRRYAFALALRSAFAQIHTPAIAWLHLLRGEQERLVYSFEVNFGFRRCFSDLLDRAKNAVDGRGRHQQSWKSPYHRLGMMNA